MLIVISPAVAASPRYTLDAIGAGARMVTASDADCSAALEMLRLTSVKQPGHTGKRHHVRCPTCGQGVWRRVECSSTMRFFEGRVRR